MSANLIKIILDTNLFVAAYWAPSSASARLIQACIDGLVQAQYTEQIRREMDFVLRTVRVSEEYLAYLERFWERAELVKGVDVDSAKTEDPDDQKFLEAAMGGEADFIVTNDSHLLRVGYIGRTEILTPASAARLLRLSPTND